ncbi:MAG: hypothetical protein ACI965_000375 [Paraglaciecola sp.]|jgi:hypothetical protein
MHILRLLFYVSSISILSGCASNILQPLISSISAYDELYLRGVFTWWEADPKYKLQKVQDSRYATTIKLIADGQPYDFKFSDALWTPGLNCGYLDKKSDQLVTLDQVVMSNCDTSAQNFKFIPSETAVYEFSIDFSDPQAPKVAIRKAPLAK